ncbi:MAG: PH domain-containing protein [Proteobacteria bacterium]|nr:PH domain-containing protein [Pseudomonadota bacterium]
MAASTTMNTGTIVMYKVWRSEAPALLMLGVLCAGAIQLSRMFPSLVVRGRLFEVGGTAVTLALPILWLIPVAWLSMILFRIYNVRYVADSRGIEARSGILSFAQQITRVRYEDVRSIESEQSILERLLDVGTVWIGTAASTGVEVHLAGVAAPKSVQEFIQNERDRRQLAVQAEGPIAASAHGETA